MAKRGGFPGGGIPGSMNNLMKQAQRMQRQMEEGQAQLASQEFEGSAGGGAVKLRLSGTRQMTALEIDKEAANPEDVEMLQDMIMAAYKEAHGRLEEAQSALMGRMGGGMPF